MPATAPSDPTSTITPSLSPVAVTVPSATVTDVPQTVPSLTVKSEPDAVTVASETTLISFSLTV